MTRADRISFGRALPPTMEMCYIRECMNDRQTTILDLLGPSELAALYRGYNARCQEIQAEREKSHRNLETRHATLAHYDLAAGYLRLFETELFDLATRNPRKAKDLAEDLAVSSDEKVKHMAKKLYEAVGSQ